MKCNTLLEKFRGALPDCSSRPATEVLGSDSKSVYAVEFTRAKHIVFQKFAIFVL